MTQTAKTDKKPRTAITPTREEDFPQWYQSVVRAADMAENSAVRGCMVIKPYGYAIWENLQREFDVLIKREGVQNAYFPLLIPLSYLSREAEHVEGFAKECAIVTHHRLEKDKDGRLVPAPDSELAEPYVIRPTSETIIGETFAGWVQSYRDLPLKINQWANVMRWEMRPRIFLRTSEFLWQEGHNVFATAEEAQADARRMLEVYTEFCENYLAMPVVPGEKTADERFPGAVNTYTIEALMQDGKALQAGTSHYLGQTFSRSANIKFLNRDGQEELAYTTSWGISTRLIGGLIMTHGDDDGLQVPPKLAPYHAVIVPILREDQDRDAILAFCRTLKEHLVGSGFRIHVDESEARTPDKIWHAIKRGVPVRIEVGKREVDEGQVTIARRDLGKEGKKVLSVNELYNTLDEILQDIQNNLFVRAQQRTQAATFDVKNVKEIKAFFESGESGWVKAPVSVLEDGAYEAVKKEYSLSSRCIPFSEGGEKVIIGKSY